MRFKKNILNNLVGLKKTFTFAKVKEYYFLRAQKTKSERLFNFYSHKLQTYEKKILPHLHKNTTSMRNVFFLFLTICFCGYASEVGETSLMSGFSTSVEACEVQLDDSDCIWLISQCPGDIAMYPYGGWKEVKHQGCVGSEDIAALWSFTYYGDMVSLDILGTQFWDEFSTVSPYYSYILPEFAFFHPEQQIDCTNMTVTPIKLEKLVMSACVKEIGKFAFAYATNLSEVNFGRTDATMFVEILETIGEGAFVGCRSLVNLEFEEGLKEIKAFAFKDCQSLSYIMLPSTVEVLGNNCFKGCEKIASIYSQAVVPPMCDATNEDGAEGTFAGVPKDANVFVPDGSLELYKSAPGWSQFTNIQEYAFSSADDVVNPTEAQCAVYNLSGVFVGSSTDGLEAGIYVVRRGTTVSKVAIM